MLLVPRGGYLPGRTKRCSFGAAGRVTFQLAAGTGCLHLGWKGSVYYWAEIAAYPLKGEEERLLFNRRHVFDT